MSVSNKDINDLMDKIVRENRIIRKKRKCSTIVIKVRKLNIYKDRIHRRLKNIETLID